MAYGLLSTGFVPKTYEVIVTELEAAWREAFGASSLGKFAKRMIAIFAERLAECWELAEDVYAAFDPAGSVDDALDMLCAITGTTRDAATYSTTVLTLVGDTGTVVPARWQSATDSTGSVFTHDEAGTLAALTAWAAATAYIVGDRRSNGGNSYICITAGTSAGSGGPTTESDDITDNTAHWRFMGNGLAAVDVDATATVTGPVSAVSGDITEIVTPVSGWSSVINLLDATEGANIETDEDLRVKRELEIAAGGDSTIPAITAALLDVTGVTHVRVFYNNTDTTDADGVPPHSVEPLVQGGDADAICAALFASVAGGIGYHGDESGTVTDSEGVEHTIRFSRPEERTIYVDATYTKDPDTYPADGDDQVKAAIVAWGDTLPVGKDVTASRVSAAVFEVTGVIDVTDIDIGVTAAPTTGITVTVTSRQLAVFDTSRITVATSDESP